MAGVTVILSAFKRNLVLSFGAETAKDDDEVKEIILSDLQSETQISPTVLGFQPNPGYDEDEEDRHV